MIQLDLRKEKIFNSEVDKIISEGIEDDIINQILREEDQAYSQNQIAKQLGVNPATALKGLNLLVEEGVLYKKRGVGMYECQGKSNRMG